jgi:transposase
MANNDIIRYQKSLEEMAMNQSEYNELQMLRSLVAEQKLKIEKQDAELQKQRIQIENLTQAILHAKKKMFGPSSEVTQTKGQLHLFIEAEQLVQEAVAQQKEMIITEYKRKARQPGVRADMIAKLPVEIIKCEAEPSEACPVCDASLVTIGSKVVRSEVVYEPAVLKVVQKDIIHPSLLLDKSTL